MATMALCRFGQTIGRHPKEKLVRLRWDEREMHGLTRRSVRCALMYLFLWAHTTPTQHIVIRGGSQKISFCANQRRHRWFDEALDPTPVDRLSW